MFDVSILYLFYQWSVLWIISFPFKFRKICGKRNKDKCHSIARFSFTSNRLTIKIEGNTYLVGRVIICEWVVDTCRDTTFDAEEFVKLETGAVNLRPGILGILGAGSLKSENETCIFCQLLLRKQTFHLYFYIWICSGDYMKCIIVSRWNQIN